MAHSVVVEQEVCSILEETSAAVAAASAAVVAASVAVVAASAAVELLALCPAIPHRRCNISGRLD